MDTAAVRKVLATGATALLAGSVLVLSACGGGSESAEGSPTATRTVVAASPTRSLSTPTEQAQAASPTVTQPGPEATNTPVPDSPAQPTSPAPPPVQPTPPPPPPPTVAPPPPPSGVTITINGVGSVFSPSSASTSVGAATTIVFNNQDVDVLHDFVLFDPRGTQLAATELASGPITQSVVFTPSAPGSYSFKCSVHPQQMRGAISAQ